MSSTSTLPSSVAAGALAAPGPARLTRLAPTARTTPVERVRLVEALDLSATTMTKIAAELMAAGHVVEAGVPMAQGVGRPRQTLHWAP